jgi:hypothetical protein
MLKMLTSETFRLFSLGFGIGAAGLLLFASPEKPANALAAATPATSAQVTL